MRRPGKELQNSFWCLFRQRMFKLLAADDLLYFLNVALNMLRLAGYDGVRLKRMIPNHHTVCSLWKCRGALPRRTVVDTVLRKGHRIVKERWLEWVEGVQREERRKMDAGKRKGWKRGGVSPSGGSENLAFLLSACAHPSRRKGYSGSNRWYSSYWKGLKSDYIRPTTIRERISSISSSKPLVSYLENTFVRIRWSSATWYVMGYRRRLLSRGVHVQLMYRSTCLSREIDNIRATLGAASLVKTP